MVGPCIGTYTLPAEALLEYSSTALYSPLQPSTALYSSSSPSSKVYNPLQHPSGRLRNARGGPNFLQSSKPQGCVTKGIRPLGISVTKCKKTTIKWRCVVDTLGRTHVVACSRAYSASLAVPLPHPARKPRLHRPTSLISPLCAASLGTSQNHRHPRAWSTNRLSWMACDRILCHPPAAPLSLASRLIVTRRRSGARSRISPRSFTLIATRQRMPMNSSRS